MNTGGTASFEEKEWAQRNVPETLSVGHGLVVLIVEGLAQLFKLLQAKNEWIFGHTK